MNWLSLSIIGVFGPRSDDDEDRDGGCQCQLKGQILAKFLGPEHSRVTKFSTDRAELRYCQPTKMLQRTDKL